MIDETLDVGVCIARIPEADTRQLAVGAAAQPPQELDTAVSVSRSPRDNDGHSGSDHGHQHHRSANLEHRADAGAAPLRTAHARTDPADH
jgi:hypothetical protein